MAVVVIVTSVNILLAVLAYPFVEGLWTPAMWTRVVAVLVLSLAEQAFMIHLGYRGLLVDMAWLPLLVIVGRGGERSQRDGGEPAPKGWKRRH